ncbi:MAG: L-seryl-tRNA(Sec) selenium transferase [Desulfovibrio sp.]|jgi:L-seryl-tRNA(Ser) seleniumtransferase|nr:L-seryl-tRNA(Sec) selenium transferase [Desulfovibrio sp.]
MKNLYRSIPSVDVCLAALEAADPGLTHSLPRGLLRDMVTAFWDDLREDIRNERRRDTAALGLDAQLPAMLKKIRRALRSGLHPVLNAAGVVVHTNLGRSVLADSARWALDVAASGYCSLEMDGETGGRGSRHDVAEDLIRRLSGAEAGVVVNNNAAAVLLALDTFCKGGEVIVSRGELVEIGGSFRIPEILEKSGVRLREVGATNRTHLRDYQAAITENTRALLRVHTSNYRIVGFQSAVPLPQLAELARKRGLPLFEDLGSGCLVDLSPYGLPPEPTVASIIAAGADLVMFSGDKALGGPQAGIIAGRKALINEMKANPLMRALRCDKLCLAALEATLRVYLLNDAMKHIPTLRMIAVSPKELARKARSLAARIRKATQGHCGVTLRRGESRVGGGAFPECELPTTLVCVEPARISANVLKMRLLACEPPLVGRLEENAFCLDPRTIFSRDHSLIARLMAEALVTSGE